MFRLLPVAFVALAACTTSTTVATTGGGGTVTASAAAEEQRRASVRSPLRNAGVSDACINSLEGADLRQVKAFVAGKRPRNSRDWIQRNQQIRTFVGRYCDPI